MSEAYNWASQARPDQLAPETDWRIWFYCAGRGAGKNRTGAEWVRQVAENPQGPPIFLVGASLLDVVEMMIRGESGILSVCPPSERPVYSPSRRTLKWPNGRTAYVLSADRPKCFHGINILMAWANEPPTWKANAFQLFLRCLRRSDSRCLITATPRPTKEVLRLLKAAEDPLSRVHVTRVSTFANSSNLSAEFLKLALISSANCQDQEFLGSCFQPGDQP